MVQDGGGKIWRKLTAPIFLNVEGTHIDSMSSAAF